jgi:hypothetical protein
VLLYSGRTLSLLIAADACPLDPVPTNQSLGNPAQLLQQQLRLQQQLQQ